MRVEDKIKITGVRVELDADDWELFTASMDCDRAAHELNEAAGRALSMPTYPQADEVWREASNRLAEYGAADSEPRAVFRALARRVFGRRAVAAHSGW